MRAGKASFPDHFSRDSSSYAKFRPRYPDALFAWLAELPARRGLAWDCGTGSGQAATKLAGYFARVIGSDASLAQLRAAEPSPRVEYLVALAEAAPLAAGGVDLVTVAQALHWLDPARFLAEVDRVAAPGAALAVWGYTRPTASPAIDDLLLRFHDDTLRPYWSAERQLVLQGYRSFDLPIDEQRAPPLAIEAELTLAGMLGYLRTWSAVGRYQAVHGRDPVQDIAEELAACWGDASLPRRIIWPLFVRAGRWKGLR